MIYLDLDGVIANLSKQTCLELGLPMPHKETLPWASVLIRAEKAGINPNDVFSLWDKESFWISLEKYPWSDKIIDIIGDREFYFLSKPSRSPFSSSGKVIWLEKNYPHLVKKLILVNETKSLLARDKYDVLIDDYSKNTKEWIEAGGSAFFWEEVSEDVDVRQRLLDLDDFLRGLEMDRDIDIRFLAENYNNPLFKQFLSMNKQIDSLSRFRKGA